MNNKLSPTPEPGGVSQPISGREFLYDFMQLPYHERINLLHKHGIEGSGGKDQSAWDFDKDSLLILTARGKLDDLKRDVVELTERRKVEGWDNRPPRSVPSPEPKVEPARRNDYENEKTFASMYLNDVYPLDVNPSPVKVGEPQTLEEPIGDLMYERYKKYCDTNPKPLLTYSGWIRKFLSDYDAAMAAKSGTADKPTYEELEASNTAWDIHCAELLEENTKLRKLAGKGK